MASEAINAAKKAVPGLGFLTSALRNNIPGAKKGISTDTFRNFVQQASQSRGPQKMFPNAAAGLQPPSSTWNLFKRGGKKSKRRKSNKNRRTNKRK
jgi:hypothetical protein